MSLPQLVVGSLLRSAQVVLRRPQCVSTDVPVVFEACRVAEEDRDRVCTGDFQAPAFAANGPAFILHSQDRGKSHAWLSPGSRPGPRGILPRLDLTAQLQPVTCSARSADSWLRRVQRCCKGEPACFAGCDTNDKNLIGVRDECLALELCGAYFICCFRNGIIQIEPT